MALLLLNPLASGRCPVLPAGRLFGSLTQIMGQILANFCTERAKLMKSFTILIEIKEVDKALKTNFLKKLKTHVKCENPFCPSCIINVIPISN
jgi:hypothetical protein